MSRIPGKSKKSRGQTFLSKEDAAKFLIHPRMHLEKLRTGHYQRDSGASIAGLFNMAIALASWFRVPHLMEAFAKGQDMIATLIYEQRPPTDTEFSDLAMYFDAAERYLLKQNRRELLRAALYVDQRMLKGDTLSVEQVAAGCLHKAVDQMLAH